MYFLNTISFLNKALNYFIRYIYIQYILCDGVVWPNHGLVQLKNLVAPGENVVYPFLIPCFSLSFRCSIVSTLSVRPSWTRRWKTVVLGRHHLLSPVPHPRTLDPCSHPAPTAFSPPHPHPPVPHNPTSERKGKPPRKQFCTTFIYHTRCTAKMLLSIQFILITKISL